MRFIFSRKSLRTTPAIVVGCTLVIAAFKPACAGEPQGVTRTFAVLFNSVEPPDLQLQGEQSLGLVVHPADPQVPPTQFHFCIAVYDSNDWETQDLLHITTSGADAIPFTVIWSEAPPVGGMTFTGPDSPLILSQEVLYGHAASGYPCSGSYSGTYYADTSPSGAAFGMLIVTAVFSR